MLDVNALKATDLKGPSQGAVTEIATALLAQLAAQQAAISAKDEPIARRESEIKLKDAKIERITFELARLKAWKFDAGTEAMDAQQCQLFEDEADLRVQLDAVQAQGAQPDAPQSDSTKRRPRREKRPEQLRRVEHHHEPESTTCPRPDCGQDMVRIGEDVSERLDVVPAEFFMHRHIRGKWACRCCSSKGQGRLVQEPVEPQIIDKGVPTAGLLAHTLVAHFVDHLQYYGIEQINARSGVHTPRSTLAACSGAGGASQTPLLQAHRDFGLSAKVLRADETPMRMLDPGAGKTAKAYVWAYAGGEHDGTPGVIDDFCTGRRSKYPADFLRTWTGALTCNDYGGCDAVFRRDGCIEAGCLAHARRKFDELARANASPVAAQAILRIARIYRLESLARELTVEARLAHRQQHTRLLWNELHAWMKLERSRVPDGGGIVAALDYSLKRWGALGRFIGGDAVSVDNKPIENVVRPWARGREAWLFAGIELAGERAAMPMSLVQSARLHGHDPWTYPKDVLARRPTHLNSRIGELLLHRWQPCPSS